MKPLSQTNVSIIDCEDLFCGNYKEEVLERFYKKLGFAWNDKVNSWDAFGDFLWFFKDSSAIFQEINPQVVQIKVVNPHHIWAFSSSDYSILAEILMVSTDNSRFDDGFRMLIEVMDDEEKDGEPSPHPLT